MINKNIPSYSRINKIGKHNMERLEHIEEFSLCKIMGKDDGDVKDNQRSCLITQSKWSLKVKYAEIYIWLADL